MASHSRISLPTSSSSQPQTAQAETASCATHWARHTTGTAAAESKSDDADSLPMGRAMADEPAELLAAAVPEAAFALLDRL